MIRLTNRDPSPLLLLFDHLSSIEEVNSYLSNWSGLLTHTGYDFGEDPLIELYQSRIFAMNFTLRSRDLQIRNYRLFQSYLLRLATISKSLFLIKYVLYKIISCPKNIVCEIGCYSGEKDFYNYRLLALYLLLQIVLRRLEVKNASIEMAGKKLADYYYRNNKLYDRVSKKEVTDPEHLQDLYSSYLKFCSSN